MRVIRAKFGFQNEKDRSEAVSRIVCGKYDGLGIRIAKGWYFAYL